MNHAIPVVEDGWFLRASKHCLTRTKDRGCNPGVIVTDDGLVFIDTPQRATDAQAWLKAARERGRPLLLINTEHHLDHCAGNGFFDVPIIAQQGTKDRFFAPSPIWGSSVANVVDMFRRLDGEIAESLSDYAATAPQITFEKQLVMSVGNVEIRAVNLPGHLPNSTVVHIPDDGVVFMSDNLFCIEMPWLHEADPREWIKSIDVVKSWNPQTIVPGHGPVSTPAALDVMRSYLVDFVEGVRHEISAGRSEQEAQANLDFLPRFVIPPHLAGLATKVQQAGIARTYGLLRQEQQQPI
jgi:cyclase